MEEWRKKLVEDNVRLVNYVCYKMGYLAIDEAEKLSAANYGLVKAAMSFDPNRGLKFSTFATTVIRNEILQVVRRESKYSRHISLAGVVKPDDENGELEDLVSTGIDDTADMAMYLVGLENLKNLLGELKGTEQKLLSLTLRHPEWTQKQKAGVVGISQSYASRIERKIRTYLIS